MRWSWPGLFRHGIGQSRQDPGRPQRAKDDAEAAAEISRHATDADPRAAAYDAMMQRVSEMWRQKDPLP